MNHYKYKDIIDSYWKLEYERYGTPQELFIKSVAFVEAKLSDNVALMSSDPTYLANLVNQSDEQRARDLDGNWRFKYAPLISPSANSYAHWLLVSP